jgi:alpha-glucosidase
VTLPFDWIHHDGSSLYVENSAPQIGDLVKVRMRVPVEIEPEQVFLRTVHDGEPHHVQASLVDKTPQERWFEADLPIRNVRSHYRWLLAGGNAGYGWLNARGWSDHDVPDAYDFAVTAHPEGPSWIRSAVVYQIYPDRFAASGRQYPLPDWAVARPWDVRPEGRSKNTSHEYFGGDLWGVAERIGHLQALGVDVIYLTPFFPAGSTHRYDASTFDHVDPLLGGDDALEHLIDVAHAAGMKVVGDITLNHCGAGHEWFVQARAGHEEMRDYFTFNPSLRHGYECWLGVGSLPKFDYRSPALRRRLISGPDSVVRSWLRFGLDGWRVDVANMSGRQATVDLTHEVARLTREVVMEEGADKVLIAEHFHDAGADLDGDGWQGSMNYSAFLRPVWSWLADGAFQGTWLGAPVPIPRTGGAQMVATIRSFSARMPWRSLIQSWSLLGSHDTARIRSVVGDDRHICALALLMTLPGTPMIFAGDELGATGLWGEDSRTTYPWDRPEEWDTEILAAYRKLIVLRKSSSALAEGGLRWIHVSDDVVVFLRESQDQRLLVAVAREACAPIQLESHRLEAGDVVPLFGSCSLSTSRGAWTLTVPHAGAGIWRLS